MHHAVTSSEPAPRRVQLITEVNFFSESNFYTGFEPSDAGVFVATYALQPIGTLVEVLIGLPGGFEIEAAGCVGWVRDLRDTEAQPGMGVAFGGLSEYAAKLIRAFGEAREPDFHA